MGEKQTFAALCNEIGYVGLFCLSLQLRIRSPYLAKSALLGAEADIRNDLKS